MLNNVWFPRFIERNERKVRLDRPSCCIFAGKTFLLCKRPKVERNIEQSLSRICNPTAPSISICNALINNIWGRKHIYALKILILITVGLQIQPSSDRRSSGRWRGDEVTAKIRKNIPAYVRAYVRTEYLLILLSPCHPSPRKDKEQ